MEAKAIAKTVRISALKSRLVMRLINGKNVSEAMTILNNLNNKAARVIKKVLTSAVANAENNHNLDKAKLYVKEAYVNDGPVETVYIDENTIMAEDIKIEDGDSLSVKQVSKGKEILSSTGSLLYYSDIDVNQ